MLGTLCGGSPYPSPIEYLIVFAVVFLAGCVWTVCIRLYAESQKEDAGNA